MSDEPKDPDADLLAPIVAIIACIAVGAKMPRRIQPGEDMIEDAARELGFNGGEWGCAPGGRHWFARAFRRLGDALAAPPEDPSGADEATADRSGEGGLEGAIPGPQNPERGAGIDSASTRQSSRTGPASHRGSRAKQPVP